MATAEELDTDTEIDIVLNEFKEVQKKMKEIQTNLKKISKESKKLYKMKNKNKKVMYDENGNVVTPKTGFALPTKLSPQLCEFLKLPHGSKLSRNDVTRMINAYILEHNLQNPSNKRNILPDNKLDALLQAPGHTDVSYFNMQRWLKPHYIKENETSEVPTDISEGPSTHDTQPVTKKSKKTTTKGNTVAAP